MDISLLHPVVVHFPIALAVLIPVVAIWVLFLSWRGEFSKRQWSVVCVLCLLMLGSSLVAINTGEEDEEVVERVVSEDLIEVHEEAAEQFAWGSGFLLVISLLPFFLGNEKRARIASSCFLVATCVVLRLGYNVGSAGGELVYKHGAASAFVASDGAVAPMSLKRHEDKDDD